LFVYGWAEGETQPKTAHKNYYVDLQVPGAGKQFVSVARFLAKGGTSVSGIRARRSAQTCGRQTDILATFCGTSAG